MEPILFKNITRQRGYEVCGFEWMYLYIWSWYINPTKYDRFRFFHFDNSMTYYFWQHLLTFTPRSTPTESWNKKTQHAQGLQVYDPAIHL